MTNAANETDQAQADFDYFIANGELPAHSPMTEDVADAVADFDGSCQAEDYLWSVLRAAYEQMRENAAMTNEGETGGTMSNVTNANEAQAPFSVRIFTPVHHCSTDAVVGTRSRNVSTHATYAEAVTALDSLADDNRDYDCFYMVADALGRRVDALQVCEPRQRLDEENAPLF